MGRAGLKHGIVASVIWVAIVLAVSGSSYASSISLVGNGYIPDPNEEVTVYIRSDTPLFCMSINGFVIGDANITSAMNESDSSDYGWDPGWTGDPLIDPAGWVDFCGVSWTSDANGIVGYFKFIYHGGEVSVSMIGEAFDASFMSVPFSGASLTFGQDDPNNNTTANDPQQNPAPQGRVLGGNFVANAASLYVPEFDPSQEYWRYMHPQGIYSGSTVSNLVTASLDATVYDANYVMTENTIWDHDVTLNGTLYVEGCQLTIMPGVSVWINGGAGGIVVRNGGAIVTASTNEHRVGFTSATSFYRFAVKIESTASASCLVENSVIMFADAGVWIENRRLDNPIQQMTIIRCGNGIYQEGPNLTDILNNEMIECAWSGIEICLNNPDDPNNTCSADTYINIEHNSIIGFWTDYEMPQYYGITIHGGPYEDKAGFVAMADNLITLSAIYAINMDGWIVCEGRKNHGYFYNEEICPYGDPWGDIEPKIVWDSPFYYSNPGAWPHLLRPDSIFVDGGYKRADEIDYLIGQTTYFGFPDVNMADIGVHYNFEGFVNAGINPLWADMNNDFGVDANDLLLFTDHWLENPRSPGYDARMEFVDANCIDFRDFAYLAFEWKKRTGPVPANIAPVFDKSPDDIKGDVVVGGPLQDGIRRSLLLMDGKLLGEFGGPGQDPNRLTISTASFPSGSHKFKFVYVADTGAIYVTSPIETTFTNAIYQMRSSESFHPSDANNRLLSGYYYGSGSLNATVRDDVSNVNVWSGSYTGHSFNVVVPGSLFGDSQMCSLKIVEDPNASGYEMAAVSSNGETEKQLYKQFRSSDWQNKTIRMAIIQPNPDISTIRRVGLLECAKACQKRNVPWAALYEHDVNQANLTYLLKDRTDTRYVYWTGHGDSFVGRNTVKGIAGVQRTHTTCWSGYSGGLWGPKLAERCVLSHTQQTWPSAPALPFEWDQRGLDAGSLGMTESNRKKIVFVDTCNSACYDDMAEAYGMESLSGYSSNDQIYIGWKKPVETSEAIASKFMTDTKETVRLFWEGMGDGKDVYDAVTWAYTNTNDAWLKMLLWGDDGPEDISNPTSHTAIGIFGRSGGLDNKLEP